MTNFKSPYFSTSIKEFWSRWHISLSTWFRDYLYIPLGGNRCSKVRHYFNLIVTFLVSGLWHGASLRFVLWGGLHGLAQAFEEMMGTRLNHLRRSLVGRWFCRVVVFLFSTSMWVLFRAQGKSDVLYVFRYSLSGITNPKLFFSSTLITPIDICVIMVYLIILAVHDYYDMKKEEIGRALVSNKVLIWGVYIFLGLVIFFCAQKGVAAEFVYFQF